MADSPPPELLAVSFAFPPLAYPRSGQVARLLKHLRFQTALVCADEKGARRDATLEPDAEERLYACLRIPFSLGGWRGQAERVAGRLKLPLWNKLPDQYAPWKRSVLKAVKDFSRDSWFEPRVLATFGQPMSDHLIGLELKKLYRVPWAAHFSDPWVDNPFGRHDALTRRFNRRLERKVVAAADLLVFTSQETVEMMMAKYPPEWRAKARVLPHSFEPDAYPRAAGADGEAVTVRYTGEFYGGRTPKPLVETVRSLLETDPQLLKGVRFELVGPISTDALAVSGLDTLPEGLVVTRPSVNYRESLSLVSAADGLLIIDAPAAKSVFLPSKLIDYVGAGRPILGLTPPGAAADLITRLGGWVADPTDVEAMRRAMTAFLSYLVEYRRGGRADWGEPEIRRSFEAPAVAQMFEGMLRELLA